MKGSTVFHELAESKEECKRLRDCLAEWLGYMDELFPDGTDFRPTAFTQALMDKVRKELDR